MVLAVLLGLIIGSFLNVVIVRLPLGKSISVPRSHCPKCKKQIAFYDNIPVLSYILLRAKCRHCGQPISIRYPAVEAVTALISLLLYLQFGMSVEWGVYFAFCCALVVLALIDVDHRILPDAITLNGVWIGILASTVLARGDGLVLRIGNWLSPNAINPHWIGFFSGILGMIIGGGLLWLVGEAFFRIRGIEGMGFGDVKMMAMVGAFLGVPLTLLTIMLGSLIGSIIGLTLIRFAGKTREYELPFGTFLGIAGIVSVLYGNDLIQYYIDHFIRPL